MRAIRTTAIAALTAVALLTPGQAFAQETATEATTTLSSENSAASSDSKDDGKKKDDTNSGSGASSDDKTDKDKGSAPGPGSNSGSLDFDDKGSLIRLGSMDADHLKIATAVVSLLSAIAGALVVVFKFIPGTKDFLRR